MRSVPLGGVVLGGVLVLGVVVLGVVVVLVGCERPPDAARCDYSRIPPVGVPSGAPVATYGGVTITDTEVAQRLAEMSPYARARYQNVAQREEYVRGVARFDLLAREAVKQGLHQHPEVVEAARRVMVQQLLTKALDEGHGGVSEAQVAEWYAAHQDDYRKPAMTRLSVVAFKKNHRAEAEATLAAALALKENDGAGFGALARTTSEDEVSARQEGDLRYLSEAELATRFGAEAVKAIEGLARIGQVVPQLVESESWLHVIKLTGRQSKVELTLEQATPSIRQLLSNDSRQARFRALVDRLEREAKLEVNSAALEKLVVDVKAPAVPARTPAPGFMPPPSEAR